MDNNFAVFILTHGRPDNVKTLQTLKKCGYTGAIYLNAATVTSNTTIPAGFNGSSAGPMTVANGITVTLANGTRWVVN